MDCEECSKTAHLGVYTVYILEGGDIGVALCPTHDKEFLKAISYDATRDDDGKPIHCVNCVNTFSDPNTAYYRFGFENGWLAIGFKGCKEHLKTVFEKLNALNKTKEPKA